MHRFPLSIFDELGLDISAATWGPRLIGLVVVWIVVYMLVRYLSRWIEGLVERLTHLDIGSRDVQTLDRLLDYIVILVGIIVSLAILGWTSLLYSALTAAGVFSVILGFAVKDVAANFISGVFILIDRPFALGDYIEVRDFSGTVESISLRSTTIVTLDGPVINIPNSILAVEPTTNYSVAQDRRINFIVSIANEADIGQAVDIIAQMLAEEEGLLQNRTQSVLVDAVREYAVDIQVICYAPTDTFLQLSSDLKQQVMFGLQDKNIELAVPTRKFVTPEGQTAQEPATNVG